MRSRALQRVIPATVCLAFGISGAAVFAQENGSQDVMVHGQPVVTTEGWSRTGIQNQRVQLSQNISYADLNLATPSGASELEARVREAANTICQKLDNFDPASSGIQQAEERINCINGAVDDAMTQVRQAISSERPRTRG